MYKEIGSCEGILSLNFGMVYDFIFWSDSVLTVLLLFWRRKIYESCLSLVLHVHICCPVLQATMVHTLQLKIPSSSFFSSL